MINKVILVGNVGKEPEYKESETFQLAKFSLATSKRIKGESKTEWHNIVIWGKLAGIVRDYVHKGYLIYVEGEIETRSYESDGVKKYTTEINCHQMQMFGKKDTETGFKPDNSDTDDDKPF